VDKDNEEEIMGGRANLRMKTNEGLQIFRGNIEVRLNPRRTKIGKGL